MKIKPGIYEHFKKDHLRYRVIGVAKHTETLEDLVVSEALYENKQSKLWVRPVDLFLKEAEVDGKKVPRFRFIRE
jgi:hypothetical protein